MMAAASGGPTGASNGDIPGNQGSARSQGGTDRSEMDQISHHEACEVDTSSTIRRRKRGKQSDMTPKQMLKIVMEKLRNCRLFLLKEQGPLSFVVRAEEEHKPSRVTLSSLTPSKCCSCKNSKFGVCLHIVFVLVRIFQLEENDPVLVNQSLSERELQHLTDNRERLAEERRQRQQEQQERDQHQKERKEDIDANPMTVCKGSRPVRKLDPEEVCPICQIDIIPEEFLTFCHSCEKHAHVKCMKAWAEHRNSHNEAVTCPLCRHEWGEAPEVLRRLQEDLKEKSRKKPKNVHFGTVCVECGTKPLYGSRYRCIECDEADLCSRCFHRCRHKGHAIVRKDRPGNCAWIPAPRECDGTSNMQPLPESLQELEHREITHEDYERLLELDRINSSPELFQYLSNCIQQWSRKDGTRLKTATTRFDEQTCVHCGMNVRLLVTDDSGCCVLPCYHLIHKNCLEDHFRGKHYRCPALSCQHKVILPGLILNTNVVGRKKANSSPSSPNGSDKENCTSFDRPNTEHSDVSLDIRGASIVGSHEEHVHAHRPSAKPLSAPKEQIKEKQQRNCFTRRTQAQKWKSKKEDYTTTQSPETLPSLMTVRGNSTTMAGTVSRQIPATSRQLPPRRVQPKQPSRAALDENSAESAIQGIISSSSSQITSVIPPQRTAPPRKNPNFSEASGNTRCGNALPPLPRAGGNQNTKARGMLCVSGQQV
eukprot:gb/GECG01007551.1/.p1 GENE.gb/GECG01007551.1/~~gb/GECG01007551.1/.p1  ORF type:complete len:708 (+),score=73.91 gb/GECG01007551.1/:1-2124(+)